MRPAKLSAGKALTAVRGGKEGREPKRRESERGKDKREAAKGGAGEKRRVASRAKVLFPLAFYLFSSQLARSEAPPQRG